MWEGSQVGKSTCNCLQGGRVDLSLSCVSPVNDDVHKPITANSLICTRNSFFFFCTETFFYGQKPFDRICTSNSRKLVYFHIL